MTEATIGHHAALIYTMVITAAADGEINDNEFKTMGTLVSTLPVFSGYDVGDLPHACNDCVALLDQEEGLESTIDLIHANLPRKLVETAYLISCEVAACDHSLVQEELRLLELLRHGLDVDRLHAAAIERGVRARYAIA